MKAADGTILGCDPGATEAEMAAYLAQRRYFGLRDAITARLREKCDLVRDITPSNDVIHAEGANLMGRLEIMIERVAERILKKQAEIDQKKAFDKEHPF
jgi:hypothetical protein